METSRNLPSIGRDFEGAKRLHIRAKDDDMRVYIKGGIALEKIARSDSEQDSRER